MLIVYYRVISVIVNKEFLYNQLFSMSETFIGGRLKLKGVKDGKVKKKKKKQQCNKDMIGEELQKDSKDSETLEKPVPSQQKRTPAELSFLKAQEKRETDRILKKAETSHRDRVEQFNEHLDNLIEHFDIPKVSWTK